MLGTKFEYVDCSYKCCKIQYLCIRHNKSEGCYENITTYETRPGAINIFVSDGKVACLKTECPAIETVCDEEMNAVAVPGTEGDCCQKYICGMYYSCLSQQVV